MINTLSKGIILEKEILESGILEVSYSEVYKVKLKAKVGELKSEKDPMFNLEANLNREQDPQLFGDDKNRILLKY